MTHHDPDANVTMPQGTEDGTVAATSSGRAFPVSYIYRDARGIDLRVTQLGMTLRQWYAGQAVVGLLGADLNCAFTPDVAVERAFKIADAMIAFEAQEGGEK